MYKYTHTHKYRTCIYRCVYAYKRNPFSLVQFKTVLKRRLQKQQTLPSGVFGHRTRPSRAMPTCPREFLGAARTFRTFLGKAGELASHLWGLRRRYGVCL